MSKIIAISWGDQDVEHVVLPEGMNIRDERARWRTWCQEIWVSLWDKDHTKYKCFVTWLLERGARVTTDDELEYFDAWD